MKGMQNTLLGDTVLHERAEILIYHYVNSGFSPFVRLVSPTLGCFARV